MTEHETVLARGMWTHVDFVGPPFQPYRSPYGTLGALGLLAVLALSAAWPPLLLVLGVLIAVGVFASRRRFAALTLRGARLRFLQTTCSVTEVQAVHAGEALIHSPDGPASQAGLVVVLRGRAYAWPMPIEEARQAAFTLNDAVQRARADQLAMSAELEQLGYDPTNAPAEVVVQFDARVRRLGSWALDTVGWIVLAFLPVVLGLSVLSLTGTAPGAWAGWAWALAFCMPLLASAVPTTQTRVSVGPDAVTVGRQRFEKSAIADVRLADGALGPHIEICPRDAASVALRMHDGPHTRRVFAWLVAELDRNETGGPKERSSAGDAEPARESSANARLRAAREQGS
ncbi:MAG: hypothetical protein R3F61_14325 [Myxococcota bacterium]